MITDDRTDVKEQRTDSEPSARADLDDVRVRALADDIIDAQKREIEEMNWLLADVDAHGKATTAADGQARPIPEFTSKDYDG